MTKPPAFIKFILHCYCHPAPFEKRDAPYYSELIDELFALDIIEIGDQSDIWVLTDKGMVYCEALLKAVADVPFPYWTCEQKDG